VFRALAKAHKWGPAEALKLTPYQAEMYLTEPQKPRNATAAEIEAFNAEQIAWRDEHGGQ